MPSIGTMGWAYITGSTVAINDGGANRVPFYKDATTLSGSADITFDSEGKLTVSGSIDTNGLVLAGAVVNATTIGGTTTIPANHNTLLYGPITVATDGALKITDSAQVKIKDFDDV